MMQFSVYKKHYKETIRLGVPIMLGQLGIIIVGFADNIMVGHHSTAELAAASFVNNFFNLVFIAGMGFSNVGLGIAHSMAHTLGAVYDTPHGVACAMMLPIVMEYNADCTGEKYREIARAMGVKGVDDMSVEEYRKAAVDAVQKLSVDVGIPTKLEALKEEDLDFLAESAHADACAPGNPKDASVEDLKALFRKLM